MSPRGRRWSSEILSGVERVRIDTDRNLLDVFDKIDGIRQGSDRGDTHVFRFVAGLRRPAAGWAKKGNDGGQFFTPREIIRAMVRVMDPKIGETVYDPGCGTGGFLAQASSTCAAGTATKITGRQLETLQHDLLRPRKGKR